MIRHKMPDINILLVGNKSDLNNQRKVSFEEGKKFKEDNHLRYFFEVSAKKGENIDTVLVDCAKLIHISPKLTKCANHEEDSEANKIFMEAKEEFRFNLKKEALALEQ